MFLKILEDSNIQAGSTAALPTVTAAGNAESYQQTSILKSFLEL